MNALVLIFFFSLGARAACLSGSLERLASFSFDMRPVEAAAQEFETIYQGELPSSSSLVINFQTLNNRVNAEINKTGNQVVINVMGGMLMHPKMSPGALKLLLCHEIGHLLGGTPLKSRNGWSSTEGQADYYSALDCAKQMRLGEAQFLDASLALTSIYAEVTRELAPKLDSCDEKKVERTNYGYPSLQCRLDTLVAGWNNHPRPTCWFRE